MFPYPQAQQADSRGPQWENGEQRAFPANAEALRRVGVRRIALLLGLALLPSAASWALSLLGPSLGHLKGREQPTVNLCTVRPLQAS